MSEYTPKQFREWAEYLAGRGSVWTLPEGIPKPSDLFRAHADALEKLKVAEGALEGLVRDALPDPYDEREVSIDWLRKRIRSALAAIRGK